MNSPDLFIDRSLPIPEKFSQGDQRQDVLIEHVAAEQPKIPLARGSHSSDLEVAVNRFLSGIVSWLRAGYPNGVPDRDYLPILALLSRRLTSDEILEVARQLRHVPLPDFVDIGAEILRITDQLPKPAEVERVRAKLAAYGWPLDNPRDEESTIAENTGEPE
jgi:hypothetical protein